MAGQAQPPHGQWPQKLKPYTVATDAHPPPSTSTYCSNRGSSLTQTLARKAQPPHRQWQQRLKPPTVATKAQAQDRRRQQRLKPHTDSGHRSSTQHRQRQQRDSTPTEGSTPTQPGVPVGARKARQQRPFKATVKAALAPSLTCSIIQQAVQFLFQSTRR